METLIIEINATPGRHLATVIRERSDGRRLLDFDGGPLLVEGEDCAIVCEADEEPDEASIAAK